MDEFMKREERMAFARQSRDLGNDIASEDVSYTLQKIRKHPSYWPVLVLANAKLARKVAESIQFSAFEEAGEWRQAYGTLYRLGRLGSGWTVYADGIALSAPTSYASSLTAFEALTQTPEAPQP